MAAEGLNEIVAYARVARPLPLKALWLRETMAATDGPVRSGSHFAEVARSEHNENIAEKD